MITQEQFDELKDEIEELKLQLDVQGEKLDEILDFISNFEE